MNLAVLIILVLLAVGCVSQQANQQEVIRIGVIAPLTGPLADLGESVRNSIELNHAKNAPARIEVKFEDDRSCNPAEAATAANKLINVDNVSVLITVCSSSTLAAVPIAESHKITVVSPVAATPLLTNKSAYVFRISASSVLSSQEAAKLAANLGFRKAAIIYEQNDYPVGWKNSFRATFESLNGTVVEEEAFSSGETDFRTYLTKAREKKPDLLLVTVLSPLAGSNIVKQARELNISAQIIGNEILAYQAFLKNSIGYSEDVYASVYKYNPDSAEFRQFIRDYSNMFGKNVTEEIYGALGYDAYTLVLDALKTCSNRDCIKDYFDSAINKEIKGISGKFYINEEHDGIREFEIRKIENGKIGKVVI